MLPNRSLTFSEIIPEIVSKYARNNALGFVDEEPVTYAEMGKRIQAVMKFLEDLDIRPGEKVVIYSQNMPNWGIVYLALQCMGIVAVPVLPDFNEHELRNVLQHSEAKAIFVSENLEYKLAELRKEFSGIIVRIDHFEVIQPAGIKVVFNEGGKPIRTYAPDENELAILLYTSGTTGNSKGVMLSQKNVLINAYQSGEVQKILETDKFLSVLPLSHTYENTIGFLLPLLSGASITYLRKPPTASVLIPAMQKVQPDIMLTVPLIIEKVYRQSVLPGIEKKVVTRMLYRFRPTRKLVHRIAGKKLYQTFGGRLKFFGIGGAKLDAQVERFLRDARFPYAIGYGLTETSPLLAGSNAKTTKYQAIGKAVAGCELKIHNPDPETGEGEIRARGPNIMLGYYKNPEITKEVMTEDGWFKTGDLGVIDRHGILTHKGRLKNLIVGANGENIYPEEIESLINNFRHVDESIVVEQKGKLVAMVYFNKDELAQKVKGFTRDISEKTSEKIGEVSRNVEEMLHNLAEELKHYINARVNKTSRIQKLVIQKEPFKKTATHKIKRYLYKK